MNITHVIAKTVCIEICRAGGHICADMMIDVLRTLGNHVSQP